jgi:hypothetical protein
MPFIQRADGDKGDVFAWWDGSALDAETQFNCDMNEAILVLDAGSEELVTTLGPGRHGMSAELKKYAGGDEVLVLFVTTSAMKVEAGGALDDLDDQPWVEATARVTVKDPVKAIELLPLLDDDELPEEWIAEELILAVARAAAEHGGALDALQAARATVAIAAAGFANEVFSELGMEVTVPEVEFSESEEE